MTDRELLELAAEAAGMKIVWQLLVWGHRDDPYSEEGFFEVRSDGLLANPRRHWNPLTDDGDALRLAVVLGLQVTPEPSIGCVTAGIPDEGFQEERIEGDDGLYAATRRAIVRAAAEIGRALAAQEEA